MMTRSPDQQIIAAKLRERMMDPAFLEMILDKMVGAGNWTRDDAEDCWVIPNKKYAGPGHSYFIMRLGGDWDEVIIPDDEKQ